MPDFVVQVTLGDETFRLDRVTVQETDRVTQLTPYKNKREWFAALQREEPKAQIAAYIIAKARDGVSVRWADVNFPDDTRACFVDQDGREVEPLLEKNDDDTLKTDADGMPLPVLRDGEAVWIYSDTGEEVGPTPAATPPVSPSTSDTPNQPGPDGVTEPGIPATVPS